MASCSHAFAICHLIAHRAVRRWRWRLLMEVRVCGWSWKQMWWYKDSEIASDYVSTLLQGLHPSSEHLLIDVGGRTLAPKLYWSSTAYHDHGTFTRKCRWSICRQNTGSHHTMQNFCSGAQDDLDCYPPSRISTVSTTFCGVNHKTRLQWARQLFISMIDLELERRPSKCLWWHLCNTRQTQRGRATSKEEKQSFIAKKAQVNDNGISP